MKQKILRITENDLKHIIHESVKRILRESYYDDEILNSDSLEDYDKKMAFRNRMLDRNAKLAQDNHPQATPYRKLNGSQQSNASRLYPKYPEDVIERGYGDYRK